MRRAVLFQHPAEAAGAEEVAEQESRHADEKENGVAASRPSGWGIPSPATATAAPTAPEQRPLEADGCCQQAQPSPHGREETQQSGCRIPHEHPPCGPRKLRTRELRAGPADEPAPVSAAPADEDDAEPADGSAAETDAPATAIHVHADSARTEPAIRPSTQPTRLSRPAAARSPSHAARREHAEAPGTRTDGAGHAAQSEHDAPATPTR